MKTTFYTLAVILLLVGAQGCGKEDVALTKRATIADQVKKNFQEVSSVDTSQDSNDNSSPTTSDDKRDKKLSEKPSGENNFTTVEFKISKSPGDKNWRNPKEFFTDDIAAAAIIRPKQVWDFPMIQELMNKGMGERGKRQLLSSMSETVPFKPETVEQIVVMLDHSFKLKQFMGTVKEGAKVEIRKGDSPEEINRKMAFNKRRKVPSSVAVPAFAMVVHFSESFDGKALLKTLPPVEIKEKTFEGYSYLAFNGLALHFSDNKTIVTGSEEVVKSLFSSKGTSSDFVKKFSAIDSKSDLGLVVETKHFKDVVNAIASQSPMLGIVRNIKNIALNVKLTSSPGENIVSLDTETFTASNAQAFAGMLNAGLIGMNAEVKRELKGDRKASLFYSNFRKGITIKDKGNYLLLNVIAPQGYDNLATILVPVFNFQASVVKRSIYKNNMKMIGLAMHNYYDTYNVFPRASGDGQHEKKGKLSWRVHLLPYIGQENLYQEFHLDEDWDSPYNKKLIERMPNVFQSEGVTENGKTAIHVFTSQGALFDDERKNSDGKSVGYRLQNITDGTSNTIMTVMAGSDKADIWTKPGGLEFDKKSPKKSLGSIPANGFITLFADGRVRLLKRISSKTLILLILYADGKFIREKF